MEKTALIVIDAQQEYFAPSGKVVLPDGPASVERIATVLDWARTHGVPVIHVVHESRDQAPARVVHRHAARGDAPEAGDRACTARTSAA